MRNFAILPFALLLVVFFSGCLDSKESIAERMLCLELSSQGFASVPVCGSQQQCFSMVNESLFAFGDSAFSFSERQQLFEYKNNLALSWFFYNNALRNIKRVREICLANDNYLALPQQINELNFNLSKAFESLDSANKSAFALMLLEQSELQKQDVSLIKEEAVFDDFILVSNNLNDLQSKTQKNNSTTFAAEYLSLASESDALAKKYGFQETIISESKTFDFLGAKAEFLAKPFVGNSFFAPFLASSVSSAINSLISSFKLSGSMNALKSFPAFEFSVLFGKMAGAENSLASEFASMQSTFASHGRALQNSNSEIEKKIIESISASKQRINELDSDNFASFDQNLLAELYSLLGQQTKIASQRFSLAQVSSMKSDAAGQLAALEAKFFELRRKGSFGEFSMGKKTSGLKQILAELQALNENLDFFSEETITGLENLCSTRAELIAGQTILPANSETQLLELAAKTKYYLEQFSAAKEKEKRLFYCRQAVEAFNSFSLAKESLENYELQLKASAKDCLVFLERLFEADSSELYAFLQRFEQLKKFRETNASPVEIQTACTTLKADIILQLSSSDAGKKTTKNFLESQSLIQSLDSLKTLYPEIFHDVSVDSLKTKAARISEFFDSDTLAFNRALEFLPELEKNSSALLQDSVEESRNALVAFFTRFAEIKAFPIGNAFLGKPATVRIVVEFSNPFGTSFDFPLSFSVPMELQSAVLSNSSKNVSSARIDSNRLFVSLASILAGKSFLELDSNFTVLAEQKQGIAFFDSQKATIRRSLRFFSPFEVQRLFVELPRESCCSASNGFAFFREKETPVSLSDSTVSFSLENVSDGSGAEVFYDLKEPIGISLQLLEAKKADKNTMQYAYLATVQNKLSFPVQNAKLFLPLPSGSISGAKLIDSKGTQKQLRAESGKLFFSVEELLPKQEQEFSLSLEIKDSLEYWLSFLQQTRQTAFGLTLSETPSVSEAAQQLLSAVDSLGQNFNGNDSAKLNELILLNKETTELSASAAELAALEKDFFFKKEETEKMLAEKNSELAAVSDLNLFKEAADLSARLSAANRFFANAVSEGESANFDAALKSLDNAKKAVSDTPNTNGLNSLLLKNRDALVKNAEFSSSAFASDANFSSLQSDIHLLDAMFLKSFSENDSNNALSLLKQLQKKSADLNAAANNAASRAVSEAKKSIDSFQHLLSKDGIASKIQQLSQLFQSASDSDLEQANYILPFSRSYLEKQSFKLGEFDSLRLQKKFSGFSELLEKGDIVGAFNLVDSFTQELDLKLGELQQMDDALANAIRRLKEDATVSVAAAKAIAEKTKNPAAEKTVALAEKELAKENFLKAIALAKSIEGTDSADVTAFASFSDAGIPLAIYPLVAVIAVALFVRRYRNKKTGEKPRFQKLLRNP